MIYLSQILNRPIYRKNRYYGSVVDFIVSSDKQNPQIAKVLITRHGEKHVLFFNLLKYDPQLNAYFLKTRRIWSVDHKKQDLYLKEDILDKQVIDINGKRVVRVNDVVLKDEQTIYGIDIGFSGVLRRLGLKRFLGLKTVILPWGLLETFDYQTGDLKVKVSEEGLNTLHAAEIANILEDVGTKERVGIMQSLKPYKAVKALEESDKNTQVSILEQSSKHGLREIIDNMEISELSDIFYQLTIKKQRQITEILGKQQTKVLKRMLGFSKKVAGGMMNPYVVKVFGDITLEEIIKQLTKGDTNPESIYIIDSDKKYKGTIYVKDLLHRNPETQLKKLVTNRHFVNEGASFEEVLHTLSTNHLQSLPVLDRHSKVVGSITAETVLENTYEGKRIHET